MVLHVASTTPELLFWSQEENQSQHYYVKAFKLVASTSQRKVRDKAAALAGKLQHKLMFLLFC